MGHYWTEVAVRGVVIDPLTGDPAILLQDQDASTTVTVPADPAGAQSIICELEGVHRDGPRSLLYRFFVRHGMRLTRVEIGRSSDLETSAALCYRFDGKSYRMDVRPADGISLAVQSAVPMFASADLITQAVSGRHLPRVRENHDLLILSTDTEGRYFSV